LAVENSELEERAVTRALGPRPDREPAPAGQLIESVSIARLSVFDDDDPVPDFVNRFHAQTREPVIRRELLFREGDTFTVERVQETIRNLQTLPQFGVVVIVALRGSAPGRVKVVVIVRDVWSLRLAYDFQGASEPWLTLPVPVVGHIPRLKANYLLVNPTEANLFGTRTQLGGIFTLQPDRYSIGGNVLHPRVAGTKIDTFALGRVFVNLDSGKPEGSAVTLLMYRELISLADKWAFLAGAGWLVEQTRLYSNREPVLSEGGIPIAYHTGIARGGAELTRSYGSNLKFNLTWGVELNRKSYEAARRPQDTPEEHARFVRDELPVSDTRVSPFFALEHRTARFLAAQDVETLSLQESFSLGQMAALRLYPAARALGSTRDLVGSVAWLGYTLPWQDGLVRALASSAIEQADSGRHQASAQGALRVVSPKLGFVRLVLDGALVSTYQNYLNRKLALGGDTRPRGYALSALRGPTAAAASLELRTSSIDILSVRVAGVAFYDVGGVGERSSELALRQSVGAGVRLLMPQFNRQVFRFDWAAPLTPDYLARRPDRPLPGAFFFGFGQAFDMPRVKLPTILGAETTLLELSQ
jgi:hypothetical protein